MNRGEVVPMWESWSGAHVSTLVPLALLPTAELREVGGDGGAL